MNSHFFTQLKTTPTNLRISATVIALLTIGGITGCQTTTNLPNPNNKVPISTSTDDASAAQTHQTRIIIQHSSENDSSQSVVTPSTQRSEINNATVDRPTVSESSRQDIITESNVDNSALDAENNSATDNDDTFNTTEESGQGIIITPPKPDAKTSHQQLLEQARQHSQTSRANTSVQNGSNVPAFQNLMKTGIAQLRQGQISAAQSTFTRAQRIAPQSPEVYYYLAQVALKQNQPMKAEAMARRGIAVAQNSATKKALWKVVLVAAKAQGNTRVIKEANAALAK